MQARFSLLWNIPDLLIFYMILALTCAIPCAAHAAENVLSINTADQPPYSTIVNTGIYDRIVTAMFARINVDIQINHLPSARSIENVDLGIDDGEYARIKNISDYFKNLIPVEEKLLDYRFSAFSKQPHLAISSWNDLQEHHTGYIRGWKIYENNAKKCKSVTLATTEDELFRLLLEDRVDIILYEKMRGIDFLQRNKIDTVFASPEPVSVRGMYLFLNKKHENLVQPLSNALQDMKREGEYQKILAGFN